MNEMIPPVVSAESIEVMTQTFQYILSISCVIAAGFCILSCPFPEKFPGKSGWKIWKDLSESKIILHLIWAFYFLIASSVIRVLGDRVDGLRLVIYGIAILSLIFIPLWLIYLAGLREGLSRRQGQSLTELAVSIDPISFFKRDRRLYNILSVCLHSHRGVFKRLDENRELLELLYKEAPEFMEKCFWVEGWIGSQDGFLEDIIKAVEFNKAEFYSDRFPRPWPGQKG